MLPKELQDLINQLPPETRVLFEAVVTFYESKIVDLESSHKDRINVLESRIKELEDQKAKNSKNSSKPPSSDEFNKPAPKSQRIKSGREPGGQKGHKGDTLKMVSSPDHTVVHSVDQCECCKKDLRTQQADDKICRQVIDIPPIKMEVTEHQKEVKVCTCGYINEANFPPEVRKSIQYGSRIKSMIVYLQDYQLLPYARTKELIKDIFGHSMSTGTLYNIRQSSFNKLATFEENLKALLINAPFAGFDETGFRIMQKRLWLHSISTHSHVYYEPHQKRGGDAMEEIGILPDFQGVAVHDCWAPYFAYNCKHALCNAHLLRDLTFIKERFKQDWPEKMSLLLLKMKASKERAIAQNKTSLANSTLEAYRRKFNAIVKKGLKDNPFIKPPKKSKGRYKKTKPRNLLERFRDYADDILRFFTDFKVPFDNNFSERDIRMMKVKQKISGCFRSMHGAKMFARTRSYIMTARKQQVNTLEALNNLFMDNTIPNKLISVY